jgi:hypothetical protein
MFGILITLSPKRLAVLEEDPETLIDVVESRDEQPIPGLLDIGNAWDALDIMLSDRGKDALLGDAVLGRSGRKFGDGSARVLGRARVAEIAKRRRTATWAPSPTTKSARRCSSCSGASSRSIKTRRSSSTRCC